MNANGSHEGQSRTRTEHRQARKIVARHGPEASVSELKGKCRVAENQINSTLPKARAEAQPERDRKRVTAAGARVKKAQAEPKGAKKELRARP